MNALGKYYHDFPRLAKESGYIFQLYRGRINWSDLDKVNVQEIIDERNFQLLEQNLIHVINCNLEREYDVKILDQNFVKLFKIAQLGVDYLSYCELYLDRCVILLQEQLASCQEECAQLKVEIDRKDEELRKIKRKAKMQTFNYKCNKCSKIFLNETYLESHQKRRHKNASERNQSKNLTYVDQAQQTDTENETISVFTQTIVNKTTSPHNEIPVKDERDVIKRSEQEIKIDNLKRDLEELKIRLSLAEKTMEEKKNDERTYANSFPSAVIPVIHSYISPTYNGQVPLISATPTIVPGLPNQLLLREQVNTCETVKKANKPEFNEFSVINGSTIRQTNVEETFRRKSFTPERVPAEGASTVRSGSVNSNDMFSNLFESVKEDPPYTPPQRPYVSLDNDIINVRPSKSDSEPPANEEFRRNLPKKPKVQTLLEVKNPTNDFPALSSRSSPVCLDSELKIESESPCESLDPRTSTPVKITPGETTWEKELKWNTEPNIRVDKREQRRRSQETPIRNIDSFEDERKSKSLLEKIVKKKSPKIQELTVNLKNSFSQLRESMSLAGKKNPEDQGAISVGKTKSDIVEGLHKRLRDLGVDPEWPGIPKETMKQKLNILEHHRNLLGKDSRLYPYLRRKLQKHVLKKIKNNSRPSEGKAQLSEECCESDMGEPRGTTSVENVLLQGINGITIYDTDRESDSGGSVTKNNKPIPSSSSIASELPNKAENISLDSVEPIKLSLTAPNETKWGGNERETTDLSIFQVGKFKSTNIKGTEMESHVKEREKSKATNIVDELETDSDFDDELFRELEQESLQCVTDRSPRKETIASFPAKPEENTSRGSSRYIKTEGQSILKSEIDNKYQLISKKKVLFAEVPEIFESTSNTTKFSTDQQKIFDLSSIMDDDDWSIESEWTVNKAL